MRKAFISPGKYVQGEDELLNLGYFIRMFGESALLIAHRDDAERVVWLYSFGQLKAGTNHVNIKSKNPNLTVTEYIITDNPAAFFIQERNARR